MIPSILLLTSSTTRRRVGAAVELDHHHAHPLRRGRLDLLDAVDARTASSIRTFTAASTPPGRRYVRDLDVDSVELHLRAPSVVATKRRCRRGCVHASADAPSCRGRRALGAAGLRRRGATRTSRTRRRRPGCGRRSPRHLRRRSARPRCPRRARILAAVRAGREKTANEAIARTRRSTGTPAPVNTAREGELGTAPSMASMSPDGPPARPALPAGRRGTPRNDRRRGAGPAGTRSTAARSVRIDNGNRLNAHRRIISAATAPRSPIEEGPGYPSGHRGAGALRERYRPRDPRA